MTHLGNFNSQFSNNQVADLSLYGYYETSDVSPGTTNRLEFRLSPVNQQLNISRISSDPAGEDNVVVDLPPLLTDPGPAEVWLGLKNSDDVGTKFDLQAQVFKKDESVRDGSLNDVPGGSSGFNNAKPRTILLTTPEVKEVQAGDILRVRRLNHYRIRWRILL